MTRRTLAKLLLITLRGSNDVCVMREPVYSRKDTPRAITPNTSLKWDLSPESKVCRASNADLIFLRCVFLFQATFHVYDWPLSRQFYITGPFLHVKPPQLASMTFMGS